VFSGSSSYQNNNVMEVSNMALQDIHGNSAVPAIAPKVGHLRQHLSTLAAWVCFGVLAALRYWAGGGPASGVVRHHSARFRLPHVLRRIERFKSLGLYLGYQSQEHGDRKSLTLQMGAQLHSPTPNRRSSLIEDDDDDEWDEEETTCYESDAYDVGSPQTLICTTIIFA
jgi:hypothetical protein